MLRAADMYECVVLMMHEVIIEKDLYGMDDELIELHNSEKKSWERGERRGRGGIDRGRMTWM